MDNGGVLRWSEGQGCRGGNPGEGERSVARDRLDRDRLGKGQAGHRLDRPAASLIPPPHSWPSGLLGGLLAPGCPPCGLCAQQDRAAESHSGPGSRCAKTGIAQLDLMSAACRYSTADVLCSIVLYSMGYLSGVHHARGAPQERPPVLFGACSRWPRLYIVTELMSRGRYCTLQYLYSTLLYSTVQCARCATRTSSSSSGPAPAGRASTSSTELMSRGRYSTVLYCTVKFSTVRVYYTVYYTKYM